MNFKSDMQQIEHIGIAVKDLNTSESLFESLLGVGPYKREEVASEAVITSFFKLNQTKIELVQSTKKGGTIDKFITKRGEGMHHIAFEVENIYHEIERLKALGFQFINDTPKPGADNKLVCFVHPKAANGVLVELCQTILS